MYPLLFDMCPLTMRTQGILLVRDAVSILDFHSTDSKTGLKVIWVVADLYCHRCWKG